MCYFPVNRNMAVILLVCLVVTAASAAPPVSDGVYRDWQQELFDRTELNKLQEVYPAKRSNYGGLYVSPCAAASAPITTYTSATASVPAYASAHPTPYYGHGPYQTVPAHHGYGPSHYGHPYYRAEDQLESEQDMLGFSDMNQATFDHFPTARSSYGAPPIVNAGPASATGPAFGVFSNANVGGCSVPLLVSCSPSIAHGRIVKSQPLHNSDAYRNVEEQPHHEGEEHQEKTGHLTLEHSPRNSKPIGDKHQ